MQNARVIVDVFREQARSYKRQVSRPVLTATIKNTPSSAR